MGIGVCPTIKIKLAWKMNMKQTTRSKPKKMMNPKCCHTIPPSKETTLDIWNLNGYQMGWRCRMCALLVYKRFGFDEDTESLTTEEIRDILFNNMMEVNRQYEAFRTKSLGYIDERGPYQWRANNDIH